MAGQPPVRMVRARAFAERAWPAPRELPELAQMGLEAAAAQVVEAPAAVVPELFAGPAELLKQKRPWKGKRHKSKQLAGSHACDKSSQEEFLSTLRLAFTDVLLAAPVSPEPEDKLLF